MIFRNNAHVFDKRVWRYGYILRSKQFGIQQNFFDCFIYIGNVVVYSAARILNASVNSSGIKCFISKE